MNQFDTIYFIKNVSAVGNNWDYVLIFLVVVFVTD